MQVYHHINKNKPKKERKKEGKKKERKKEGKKERKQNIKFYQLHVGFRATVL